MLKVSETDETFDYFLNDPTTPSLFIKVPFPELNITPKIKVIGLREDLMQSKNFLMIKKDPVHLQALGVYLSISVVLNWINKIRKIEKWAFTDVLTISPRAGRRFNAYYDRTGLRFFYERHPVTNKIVFTADSTEAVYHEFGHAILDTFRPDLWDLINFEIFAFHEAFGDIISMISSMQHQSIIDHAIFETGGNLKKSNVISRIAEELGNALYHMEPNSGRMENCLRDASIRFSYVFPEKLPSKTTYDKLCKESHNFSRVFSSTWYAGFVGVYEEYCKSNNQSSALIMARDFMAKLTLEALKHIKNKNQIYHSMSNSMLITCSKNFEGEHFDVLKRVFIESNVISSQLML